MTEVHEYKVSCFYGLWRQIQVYLISAELINNSFYGQLFYTSCYNSVLFTSPVCYWLEVLVWVTFPATDVINAWMQTLEKNSMPSSWVLVQFRVKQLTIWNIIFKMTLFIADVYFHIKHKLTYIACVCVCVCIYIYIYICVCVSINFFYVTIWNVLHSVKWYRKADIYETYTRKQVVNPFQSVVPAFTYDNNTGKTSSHIKRWSQSEWIWNILNTSLLVLC
jgi:hypothetical protein